MEWIFVNDHWEFWFSQILWKAQNNNWHIGNRIEYEVDYSGIFAAGYTCPYEAKVWYKLSWNFAWEEIPDFKFEDPSEKHILNVAFKT